MPRIWIPGPKMRKLFSKYNIVWKTNPGFLTRFLGFGICLGRILLGLFFGKQLGVFVFSYISIKTKIAQMPNNSNWYNFYGVGVLTGIGFTMSLFVGNLAFVENMQYMNGV